LDKRDNVSQLLGKSWEYITNNVIEDWIFECDADEYLYLHGLDIKQYLGTLDQDIHQVQFPWIMIQNIEVTPKNPFDLLVSKAWISNPHIKSMSRTKSIIKHLDVHHCHVLGNTRYDNKKLNNYSIAPYYFDYYQTYSYDKNPVLFHFFIRGFQDVVLKSLCIEYYPNKLSIINAINSGQYTSLYGAERFAYFIYHGQYKLIPKFNVTLTNEFSFDTNLLNNMITPILEANNINIQNYETIRDNPWLIYNKPKPNTEFLELFLTNVTPTYLY